MTITDFEIIDMMLMYGGGFVMSLARCWQAADSDNQRRLKIAFPEVWKHYEDLARMSKQDATKSR